MKGPELNRMTPEKLRSTGLECLRRAQEMEDVGGAKDAIRKNLLPAMQRMRRAKHELQCAVDLVIDKVAELEKYESTVERLVDDILGRDAGTRN
ncbi:hypothetical protein M8A54_000375 [Salmonella enterica]|nr:hypothetical protein [Salmonella enterica]